MDIDEHLESLVRETITEPIDTNSKAPKGRRKKQKQDKGKGATETETETGTGEVGEEEEVKPYDELIDMLHGSGKKKRANTRQRKANSEKRMRETKARIRQERKVQTLKRASLPRNKHTRLQKSDGKNFVRFKYPSVEETHQTHLAELQAKVQAGKEPERTLRIYEQNYNEWLIKQGEAVEAAKRLDEETMHLEEMRKQRLEKKRIMDEHKRMFTPCLEAIATAVPHASGTKMGSSTSAGVCMDIRTFFSSSVDENERFCKKEFKRIYHEKVKVASNIICEWPDTLQQKLEKRVESIEATGSSSSSSSSSALDHQRFTCDDCKTDLFVDSVTGTLVCKSCGVSVSGGEGIGYKQSFSESQSKNRGAAPYERLAHVSFISFVSLI